MFSCSQIRTTVQPASVSQAVFRASLSTFRASFGDQYDWFTDGFEPCSGQQCQKQPSTNTATRLRVNTISGRTRPPGRSIRKSHL
jgi:hypothetical protein